VRRVHNRSSFAFRFSFFLSLFFFFFLCGKYKKNWTKLSRRTSKVSKKASNTTREGGNGNTSSFNLYLPFKGMILVQDGIGDN
jgi:hypothetical protein